MKSHSSRLSIAGFSLVEVVLAIGITTFSLVSILGLLNVAADTDGAAGRDTTLVAMSNYVLNDLHSLPFDSLWLADPTTNRDVAPTKTQPADSIYYFTNEGTPVPASSTGNSFDVLYKCVVHKVPDEPTKSSTTNFYNQLKVQLEFSWPATVGGISGKAGTQTLYASIARR